MKNYQQLDHQLKSISLEADDLKKNPLLLELVILLLKEIHFNDSDIRNLVENDDLIDYLIEYNSIFKEIDGFIGKIEQILPVESLKNNIMNSLAQIRERLTVIQPTINQIKSLNKDLLDAKDQLLSESNALNLLETEVQELTTLKQKVSPKNLERLRNAATELEADTCDKKDE